MASLAGSLAIVGIDSCRVAPYKEGDALRATGDGRGVYRGGARSE